MRRAPYLNVRPIWRNRCYFEKSTVLISARLLNTTRRLRNSSGCKLTWGLARLRATSTRAPSFYCWRTLDMTNIRPWMITSSKLRAGRSQAFIKVLRVVCAIGGAPGFVLSANAMVTSTLQEKSLHCKSILGQAQTLTLQFGCKVKQDARTGGARGRTWRNSSRHACCTPLA